MLLSNLKELPSSDYDKIVNRRRPDMEDVARNVGKIVEDVMTRGDLALREYTQKFDGAEIKDFRVPEDEFKEARNAAKTGVLDALKVAKEHIEEFQRKQLKCEWSYEREGAEIGQVVRPIQSVGCYVPGGKAAYPSTVLMTVIPAIVAGVERIAVMSPPQSDGKVNGTILAACDVIGVTEVYCVGGAQAIAAFAFGTESIPKVDKIVGPGNVYVTAAKKAVSDTVAIDLPAGPSEVLIIADDSANPKFVAIDMLAQAEHDTDACAVLVTTSRDLADAVGKETGDINGAILIADSMANAIDFSNAYAPEHLEIATKEPEKVLEKIKSAGSIFLGNYTPVACGDYASGTNHVLPTGGFARAYSGLSIFDFLKLISVQKFDKEALKKLSNTIITLAEAEGLKAHAESIRRRLK